MQYLLVFILLAYAVGLRSAPRPATRAWPFVVLAFALGAAFLNYGVI